MAKAKTTNDDQIRSMQKLGQRAAAWLAGIDPRNLRDRNCPRNSDGSYDARSVLEWARSSRPDIKRSAIDDETAEQLLQILTEFECEACDGLEIRIVDLLGSLEKDHGESGLLLFVSELRRTLEATIKTLGLTKEPTEVDPVEVVKLARQRATDRDNYLAGRVAVFCGACGRIRKGEKWLKGTIPSNFNREPMVCPTCEAKGIDS